jgi:hypothetical protein
MTQQSLHISHTRLKSNTYNIITDPGTSFFMSYDLS